MPIQPPECCKLMYIISSLSNSMGFILLEIIEKYGPISCREIEKFLEKCENLKTLKGREFKAPADATIHKFLIYAEKNHWIKRDSKSSGKKKNQRYKITDRGKEIIENFHKMFLEANCKKNCFLKNPPKF